MNAIFVACLAALLIGLLVGSIISGPKIIDIHKQLKHKTRRLGWALLIFGSAGALVGVISLKTDGVGSPIPTFVGACAVALGGYWSIKNAVVSQEAHENPLVRKLTFDQESIPFSLVGVGGAIVAGGALVAVVEKVIPL